MPDQNAVNIIGIIGTLLSLIGLILTIISYIRIKQVNEILYDKSVIQQLNYRISKIMQYPLDQPLSNDNKQNITSIAQCIKLKLNPFWFKNRYEKEWLGVIKKELVKKNPSIALIQENLQSLKSTILREGA